MGFKKYQFGGLQNPPKKFLSANASKIEVAELWVEHDEDAEAETDQGQGCHQNFPHL